jgi:hypothetical protein
MNVMKKTQLALSDGDRELLVKKYESQLNAFENPAPMKFKMNRNLIMCVMPPIKTYTEFNGVISALSENMVREEYMNKMFIPFPVICTGVIDSLNVNFTKEDKEYKVTDDVNKPLINIFDYVLLEGGTQAARTFVYKNISFGIYRSTDVLAVLTKEQSENLSRDYNFE